MKKTVLRYGFYASVFMVLFFVATFLITGSSEKPDYKTQEIIGYAGIILSLLFIFAGIKYYRDKVNSGSISFGKAMKLGLLICLLPALAFGLFNVIYVMAIDPDFTEKYYSAMLSEMKTTLTATEYDAQVKVMESQKEMFSSPFVQFAVMFLTVYLVGIVITVLSALILRRR